MNNLAQIGIEQSSAAQEVRVPGWAEIASNYLQSFLIFVGGDHFTIEDFRAYAEGNGLPVPENGPWSKPAWADPSCCGLRRPSPADRPPASFGTHR